MTRIQNKFPKNPIIPTIENIIPSTYLIMINITKKRYKIQKTSGEFSISNEFAMSNQSLIDTFFILSFSIEVKKYELF